MVVLAPYDFLDKASKGLICCISLRGMNFPCKHIILEAFSSALPLTVALYCYRVYEPQ